ncbi:hypothetical protein Tco_0064252 [Tanacetum coccineum]
MLANTHHHAVASPTSLPDSTPPTCHTKESEDYDTSGVRSTSSDSTTSLSPDHPLTHTSPTPIPTRTLFHRRTARMTVRAQPVMSPGHSARVAEVMALSDSALRNRYRSFYETSSSSSPALLVRKRYQGTFELILDMDSEGQQRAVSVVGATVSSPLGLGFGALRRQELAVEEDQVYSTFEIGQGSGSILEPVRPERVSALRYPTLTTWIDLEDSIAYIDILAYPPPAPPAQTPPSPEWSFGSLLVSPAPSAVPSPISSPMTVSSPIASPVTTLTATIPVDED